jgi:hypothetical protein
MSRTRKEGKRFCRQVSYRPEASNMKEPIFARQTWGSTEKILRRNRKLWTRLLAKRRRALGKQVIQDQVTAAD